MKRRVTLVGLIEAACALVVFATLAGFLGGWSWVLELFDHFRLHYMVGALVMAGLAWWATRHRWALACLAVFFVNLYLCPAVLSLMARPAPPAMAGQEIRVAAINLLTSNRRHDDAVSLIREESPDVVLLMETDAFWWVRLSELLDDYRVIAVELRPDNFGIAMLAKHEISGDGGIFYPGTMQLPAIHARLSTPDGTMFDVLGIHTTPPANLRYRNENRTMLDHTARYMEGITNPVVVLGDLNITPWSARFRALLASTGLIDTARYNGYLATWPTMASPVLRIPLDHCLVTPGIGVAGRHLGKMIGSDHLPLFVDLIIPTSPHADFSR